MVSGIEISAEPPTFTEAVSFPPRSNTVILYIVVPIITDVVPTCFPVKVIVVCFSGTGVT